jgi:hypothetical protein
LSMPSHTAPNWRLALSLNKIGGASDKKIKQACFFITRLALSLLP